MTKRSISKSWATFSFFYFISFHLEQLLSLSIVSLTLLKSMGQLSCRLSLSSDFGWCFLLIGVRTYTSGGNIKGCCFSLWPTRWCMVLTFPNTGGVLFDHLISEVPARVPLCTVLFCAFAINKYFMGRNFGPM